VQQNEKKKKQNKKYRLYRPFFFQLPIICSSCAIAGHVATIRASFSQINIMQKMQKALNVESRQRPSSISNH